MAEVTGLSPQEREQSDRASLEFYNSLLKEFPGIPENRFDAHMIVPGKDDARAWELVGLKPGGPAYVVEVSPQTLLRDLPSSTTTRGTPIEGGFTLIIQPDKDTSRIVVMPATLGSAWTTLDQASDRTRKATYLNQYVAQLSRHGRSYAPSEIAQKWARFGKESDASVAFHKRMVQEVIRTPEMEKVLSLAFQKAAGKDYTATAGIHDFAQAVVRRDAKSAKDAVEQLMTMEPLDKQLADALARVRDMQKKTRDDFENQSSWALTGPDVSDKAARENRVLEAVTAGVAAGTTIFVGGHGFLDRVAVPISLSREPVPITAPAQYPQEALANHQVLWGEAEAKSSPKLENFSVRDLMLALNLPIQSESVVPLTPADMRALQEDGMKGLGEQWVQSLSKEVRQKVESVVARVEAQAISMSDAVVEIGQTLQSDPKLLAWFAGTVVFDAAVIDFTRKHWKKILLGAVALGILTGCVGTSETPRASTPTAGIEDASQSWSTILVKDQDGREYTIQNEKTIIIDKLHGYTAEENETVLKTEKTYQFSSVALKATDGESAGKTAILLQELNADGGIDAELVLMKKTTLANGDTQFSLFSPDGADSGFTLVLQSNGRIILHLEGTDAKGNAIFQDYVLDVDSADGSGAPTALPTKSPSVLMNALTALIDLDAGEAHALEPSTPPSTETPTATPEPTKTPDPLVGAPEGATGKDSKGNYIKTVTDAETGKTTEYSWTSLKDAKGEVLYEGWTDEKTQKGGIPLLDFGDENLIPLSLFVAYDVPGGSSIESLSHQDDLNLSGGGNESLTGIAIAQLFLRKNINMGMSNQPEMQKFMNDVSRGVATLPLVASTGEPVEGKLGPKTGFITIVVPFDSLVPAEGNGVSEWWDPYPTSRSRFRSVVLGVDKDGNVIELLASEKPLNELPDNLVRALALHLAANIIQKEDQTTQGFPTIMQMYVKKADAGGDEKVPEIIITRNP